MDFYSDRSNSSHELVVDLDPPGAQQGGVSMPPRAPLDVPLLVHAPASAPGPALTSAPGPAPTSAPGPTTGPGPAPGPGPGPAPGPSGALFGAAGPSWAPPASSGFGYVPPFGSLNFPRTPYVSGPGQLYAHGSPGLAATYVSPSYYGVGMLPTTSQPRMSLAPDLMFPQPAMQPYGSVQELLARRAHLDHALASMVSLMFYFFYANFGC